MKAISEYTIGTTAVRIVDTGRRIRVINVEKEREKRHFQKTTVSIMIAAALTLLSSLTMVRFQSSQTMLDKQVYQLKTEVDLLERENKILEKKLQDEEPSYAKVYKRALEMGMDFPTGERVRSYIPRKGSCIRIYKTN